MSSPGFELWVGPLERRRISSRVYLLGLIAAAVIPVWLFATYLLVSFAFSKQEDYRAASVQFARHAATVVDASLIQSQVRLDGLARSAAAAEGNLAELHADARRLVADTSQTVLLLDAQGTPLFSTAVDFGKELEPAFSLGQVDFQKVFKDRQYVGDVLGGTSGDGTQIAVLRAITIRGTDAAILAMIIPARELHEVLAPAVPEGWVVGVADRNGVYVTRSQRHEEVAGTPGLPAYLALATGSSGSFESENRFGDTLLAGYVKSDVSGWLYAANIPRSIVEAPLWGSLAGAAGIGLGALLLSLALAYAVGQYLTKEADELSERAMALARGEEVASLVTHFKEFAIVGEAIGSAGKIMTERTKELQAVLETVPAAVWFTYDPAGRLVVRNRFAAQLMGLPPEDSGRFNIPDQVIDTIAMKDGQVIGRDDRPLTRAMRGEHTDHEEFDYLLPSGGERHLVTSARPITDEDGAILGAVQVSLDITDRKRSEDQRRLLAKELNHRVKNNLAIVQALAQQTIRNAGNLQEAGTVLSARLAALGAAHDVLIRNAWSQGDLNEVLQASVLPQAPAARVELNGPDLALEPGSVLAVTLAMHELTTNAIKYGALSNTTGRVAVVWRAREVADRPGVEIVWREIGGPAVSAPDEKGFGSRLLKRITAGEDGSATTEFEPTGLVCTIRLPLARASTDSPA